MHRDPDADALGSSLGWSLFLEKTGHQVTVISPTTIPANLKWLPGSEKVLVYEESESSRGICKKIIEDATLICCLDFSAISRLKDLGKIIEKAGAFKLMIDHHIDPEPFADLQVWDVNAPATALLIYRIVSVLGPETLDIPMAECLYSGIMTDTGSFRHSNTTPETHRAVAELMTTGFDSSKAHRLIFDNSPVTRLQLLGHALSGITVLPEYRTAYMSITQKELEEFGSSVGDTDGIVNFGLQVKDVVMSVLFIERKGEIKISFRSSGDFSVRELANAHFSGGGHRNASGGRTTLSLAEAIQKFTSLLPQYEDKLRNTEN